VLLLTGGGGGRGGWWGLRKEEGKSRFEGVELFEEVRMRVK
jgi:hypothetical protein